MSADHPRPGRRQGIRVDAAAVRRARKEAGLSMAEVAAGEVSRAAIHLIEAGSTRPSLSTLRHIARKTGKPLTYFLSRPIADDEPGAHVLQHASRLRELDRLVATRDFKRAVVVGSELLSAMEEEEAAAQVHYYLGQAHCRLVEPEPAIQHLTAARELYEELGDAWMVVACMDWQAMSMSYTDDPRALPLAQEALIACRQLDPVPYPTLAQLLSHIASMYLGRHSWQQAIRHYEMAIEAAGPIRDLLMMAKMYDGLSLAYQRLLQPDKALRFVNRARALYSLETDLSLAVRAENNLGDLLMSQGDLQRAEHHFRSALEACDSLNVDRRSKAYVLLNMGDLHSRLGKPAVARTFLEQATRLAQALDETAVVASAHLLLGHLEEEHSRERADTHFSKAIKLFAELDMPDRLREAHMAYAASLESGKDFKRAALHWRLAAEIASTAPHPSSRQAPLERPAG